MIRNFVVLALRNLQFNPAGSFINIFSLAIGFAACLILFLFIRNEKEFDSFHSKKERIYRLYTETNFSGTGPKEIALSMGWVAPLLPVDFGEVERSTRFWNRGKGAAKQGDKLLMVENMAAVDSTFFEIFDFNLLNGDAKNVLDDPHSIVLTERTAGLLFDGHTDVLGEDMLIDGEVYKVTGIVQDPPLHSHLQFSALLSINTFSRNDRTFATTWEGSFLNTYVLLEQSAQPGRVESKLGDFL